MNVCICAGGQEVQEVLRADEGGGRGVRGGGRRERGRDDAGADAAAQGDRPVPQAPQVAAGRRRHGQPPVAPPARPSRPRRHHPPRLALRALPAPVSTPLYIVVYTYVHVLRIHIYTHASII